MVDRKTGVKPKAKKTETKAKAVKKAEVVIESSPIDKLKANEPKIEIEPVESAKAGKRSAKAIRESEEKISKATRKTALKTEKTQPHTAKKPPRSRLERAGKKYRELAKQIDNTKAYELKEAVELLAKTSPTKFDATAELHVRLNVDPKQADQNIRGIVNLPAGTGKNVKAVAVDDKLLAELEKGQINFDVLVASPDMMPKLGKYAKLLGPKGLMPNPKSGTVTTNVAQAVKEAQAGRLEYRVDSSGIVHVAFGKVSFGTDKLLQNAEAVIGSIRSAKPASVKANYIETAYLTTTMGPSIKIEV